MRISPAAKEETRQRIIAAAVECFRDEGFDAATTRNIARKAKIAAGTLFNYFPTKEAIVYAVAAESLRGADNDFAKHKRPAASLEEDVFLYVSAGLRRLRRHRAYLHAFVQLALSPLTSSGAFGDFDAVRLNHLQQVQEILTGHDLPEISPTSMQLYWSLYLGLLSYWIGDRSPKQEDSLVLLDQSISMFCDWLRRERCSAVSGGTT